LVDIDIQSEISAADEALLNGGSGKQDDEVLLTGGGGTKTDQGTRENAKPKEQEIELGRNDTKAATGDLALSDQSTTLPSEPSTTQRQPGKHASLATPAVRHMVKEHKLKIEDIEGTGREGRVLKDDEQRHI
jgi:2-oxoisovalerate dehydrogenase E2 component (dihydrolipoyl transacylase)